MLQTINTTKDSFINKIMAREVLELEFDFSYGCYKRWRWNVGTAVAEAGWLWVRVYFDVLFMVVVFSCCCF